MTSETKPMTATQTPATCPATCPWCGSPHVGSYVEAFTEYECGSQARTYTPGNVQHDRCKLRVSQARVVELEKVIEEIEAECDCAVNPAEPAPEPAVNFANSILAILER